MTMAMAQNQVVTPEAVPLELETANIGSRCLAVMIDWLIQGTTLFALIVGFTALVAAGSPVPRALEASAQTPDVARLTGDDYRAARTFLLRAGSLAPAVRYDLALRIAEPVAERVQPAPPAGVPPEAFLLCVAAV